MNIYDVSFYVTKYFFPFYLQFHFIYNIIFYDYLILFCYAIHMVSDLLLENELSC